MRPHFSFTVIITLFVAAPAIADDLFLDHVVPVLQERCLSCHNSLDRKGDFALQTANEISKSGFVEPGDSAASHLLAVLLPVDGKRPSMPKDGNPLSQKETASIARWIADGAKWPDGFTLQDRFVENVDWWSLKPLVRPDVPVPGVLPVRTPIDAFIGATLRDRKLTHSPEADRLTLIRRLTYDLTGLPPTPEAVAGFLSDTDSHAYEKLVERLLQSPQYGERWARHWLDVVRYADTCGYDKDKLRPNAWPYRDYVVRSFNQDKPYARFVEEQIAGDVLFPGEPDGILGLGFIAAGPWDFIGHVEVPESKLDGKEARNLDRDEMVTSTLNTFCSATVQCARCHNHKFDPFTMEHYYSLQSVFAAVDRAERPYDLDPQIESQRRELTDRLKKLEADQKALQAELSAAGGEALKKLEDEIARLKPSATPAAKKPEFGYHSMIAPKADTTKWVQIDLGREIEISRIVIRPCHDEFAGIGAGFGFPVRFCVSVGANPAACVVSEKSVGSASDLSTTVADFTSSDFANPGLRAVTVDLTKSVVSTRFIRLTATKLAERKNDFILALAELQAFDRQGNNVALKSEVESPDSIEAPVRWARTNLTDGIWAEAADPQAVEALARTESARTSLLATIRTPERVEREAAIAKNLTEAQQSLAALPAGQMVYAAATHFKPQGGFQPTQGKPRDVRILHRGNITQPLEKVVPGTLPILGNGDWKFELPSVHTEGDRRAALAHWITRRDNPLTWRSIVNRVWQYHFGRGLVDSPNDFGRMGQLPTHPELLDWLAVEFRDGGQSFRDLHRLIVTSSVYRQSSASVAVNVATDGGNQYLWRMNRRRLEAEELRDSILSVSGRLNLTMGGPGYYLFVLEKTAHSPHYEYHLFDPDDEKSHRRSLYRFIVRSQPDPFMTTLDCADSSQSTPRRDETLTALQALSLLNNRFNLTMAEHFAERLQKEFDNLPGQVSRAMQLVAGREPTAAEQDAMQGYATEHGLPNLCRVLFNMSEFVFVE